MKHPAIARPAATLVLLRDGQHGPEVLLLQRGPGPDALAGAFVFPGGVLDATDHSPRLARLSPWLDDATASRALGVDSGGLGYWMAAIRETFEEAGLMLAYERPGQLLDLDSDAEAGRYAGHRSRLHAGEATLEQICEAERLVLATDRIAYLSHWITPISDPRRYDTRFFVAVVPPDQRALHDDFETVDHLWVGLREALRMAAAGGLYLRFPTRKTIEALAPFASTGELLDWVRRPRRIETLMPWVVNRGGEVLRMLPGDPGYDEARLVNPSASPEFTSEARAGVLTALSPRVRRLVAPNPGVMTGPGTNSYLVGGDQGPLALIDPGPDLDPHVERLLALAGRRLRWIVCTHTHLDHSPAAQRLKAATGALLAGRPAPPDGNQDRTFAPDLVLAHGDRIEGGDFTLRALHTPGHASNHLCYLLEGERWLFTGDHVMQGSTVVIAPPDGDMAVYLRSLEALLAEDLAVLAPGHGYLITRPHEALRDLIRHRLGRERKVADALAAHPGATLDELLPVVYDDAPLHLHPVARRSLHAHLLKLAGEGRAFDSEGRWRAV